MEGKIDRLVKFIPIMVNNTIKSLNPYTQSYASFGKIKGNKSERGDYFRENLLQHLGYTTANSATMSQQLPVRCMVSGIESSKKDDIRAAHIIPAKTQFGTLQSLNLNEADVDSPKNGLLLAFNIERAFDSMWISFVQNPLKEGRYLIMKIWNEENFIDHPLFPGCLQTIMNFKEFRLNLSLPFSSGEHNPLLRGLAFQVYHAYNKHYPLVPMSVELSHVLDYSSDKDSPHAELFRFKIAEMCRRDIEKAQALEEFSSNDEIKNDRQFEAFDDSDLASDCFDSFNKQAGSKRERQHESLDIAGDSAEGQDENTKAKRQRKLEESQNVELK